MQSHYFLRRRRFPREGTSGKGNKAAALEAKIKQESNLERVAEGIMMEFKMVSSGTAEHF